MNKSKYEFGKRLAEIRKGKNLNQQEFKNIVEAPTVQMVSCWENGHSFPSVPYLITFAKRLDISLDYLLLGKQNEKTDKKIKTYKDAAECMMALISSGLFEIQNTFITVGNSHKTVICSEDETLSNFKKELQNLLVASETLRSELFQQAISDLLEKYDFPLKNND